MSEERPKYKRQPKKEPTDKAVVAPQAEILVSRRDIADLNQRLSVARRTAIIAARVMEIMLKTHQCHGRPCEPCLEARVLATSTDVVKSTDRMRTGIADLLSCDYRQATRS